MNKGTQLLPSRSSQSDRGGRQLNCHEERVMMGDSRVIPETQAANLIEGIQGRLHRWGDFQTGCWKRNRSWQVLAILGRKVREAWRTWVTQGPGSEWVWLKSRMPQKQTSGVLGGVLRRDRCWGGEIGRERERILFWMCWVWCACRTFKRVCGAGAEEQGWEIRI